MGGRAEGGIEEAIARLGHEGSLSSWDAEKALEGKFGSKIYMLSIHVDLLWVWTT